jgi:C4-dicarboxylate-specific signal transduction histidine kinase
MTDAMTPTDSPTQESTQPWLTWMMAHRRISIAGAVVVVLALVAFVDWPHRATAGQLRSDFAQYATQVRGDVQSCSVEVEETLSAYNQITAGVVRDRQTAEAIASQTALDCTPMGNSRIDDLGTLQPPSSLADLALGTSTQDLYTWCYPAAVDVAQDIEHLMSSPGDPATLADVKTRLAQMNTAAASAQNTFNEGAGTLNTPPVDFGLDQVRASVLVG